MSLARIRIVGAICRERDYQDDKWGSLDENPHTVAEFLLIMESELAEAKQAWVKGHGDQDALRELLQVVAVGFACLEQHGVVERKKVLQENDTDDRCSVCERLQWRDAMAFGVCKNCIMDANRSTADSL
jgi:hypothetical protein